MSSLDFTISLFSKYQLAATSCSTVPFADPSTSPSPTSPAGGPFPHSTISSSLSPSSVPSHSSSSPGLSLSELNRGACRRQSSPEQPRRQLNEEEPRIYPWMRRSERVRAWLKVVCVCVRCDQIIMLNRPVAQRPQRVVELLPCLCPFISFLQPLSPSLSPPPLSLSLSLSLSPPLFSDCLWLC
uniref:Homeobox domain-containing protein n=1 Tax=Gasterosteus aculeatus aculeatus TaxID=481459 RepID=A0AAQ4Q7Q3_GASAC